MNLVTAVIVEHAMFNSQNDHHQNCLEKEAKQAKELMEIEWMFKLMDADGSGTISWKEFKDSFADPEMCKKWTLLDFSREQCNELFQLLDHGNGEIEIQRFFEGLTRMRGVAQAKDVFRLQKSLDTLADELVRTTESRPLKQKKAIAWSNSTILPDFVETHAT